MRSSLLMAARLCFVLLLLQLFSCSKIDLKDLLHHPDKVPQLCDIKKITSYRPFEDTVIATFQYNQQGNPTKVLLNHPGTGRPQLFFRYDKKNRITDYYGAYQDDPNSSCEFWTRYVYDAQGKKIVGDSTFGFAVMHNNEPVPYPQFITVATYEYDSYARLVKVLRRWINIPSVLLQTYTYTYDNNGNRTFYRSYNGDALVFEVAYTYGDKPNLHRTNPVWMQVDADYSVNSAIPTVSYNKYGLPLKTTGGPAGATHAFLYQIDVSKADFEYDCK